MPTEVSIESAAASDESLEALEIRLLLDGLYHQHGLDFRNYSAPSLKRRVQRLVGEEGTGTIVGLLERVLHDPGCVERVIHGLTVNVTSMFRDPEFFRLFREKVVPRLRTYPALRLWVAGCATGEEVYSLAILLDEEELLERTHLYGTDLNETVLDRARGGLFPLRTMREYTENYLQSGGQREFSEYYTADSTHALFSPRLRRHITFARHNLATDSSFNEFQVICCRNVMIYFDQNLQQRVFKLLHESLSRLGHLCLGRSESLIFNPHADEYHELSATERIYRRKT